MAGSNLLAQKVSARDNFGFDHKRMINALRGVAQDNARNKIEAAQFVDVTDSTTGTVGTTIASVALPAAAVGAATTSSPKAGFDAATLKLSDAAAAFAEFLNPMLAQLGLDQVVQGNGTVNTSGTIDALDKVLAAVDGSSGTVAVDVTTGTAQLTVAKTNQALLTERVNAILVAVGDSAISGAAGAIPVDNATNPSYTLGTRAATATGVGGTTKITMLDTEVDTALTNLANNYATMADMLNRAVLTGTGVADLTDNSGGTASDVIADVTPTLVAFQSVGTDDTPQVGLAAEIAAFKNNYADLTARINLLAVRFDVPELVDSSGGTATTTIEAQLAALVAVTGIGSTGAPFAGSQAIFDAMGNNIASLAAKVNALAPFYGAVVLTDNSGGTASSTIVDIGTLGAGVDNNAAATGLEDAAIDPVLAAHQNAVTSLAAKLAEMTGTYNTQAQTKPLNIVAVA